MTTKSCNMTPPTHSPAAKLEGSISSKKGWISRSMNTLNSLIADENFDTEEMLEEIRKLNSRLIALEECLVTYEGLLTTEEERGRFCSDLSDSGGA